MKEDCDKKRIEGEAELRGHLELLARRPLMFLVSSEHRLHRLEAFLAGVRLGPSFGAVARRFFLEAPERISKHLDSRAQSLYWFSALVSRHNGDEVAAFDEAMAILELSLEQRPVVSSSQQALNDCEYEI